MTIQGSFLDTIQSAFTFPFEKTGFNSEKDITEELEQASIGQEAYSFSNSLQVSSPSQSS
jgi:hypothetical protein